MESMRVLFTLFVVLALFVILDPMELREHQTPGPRYGHELVFDEARNITLLFSGFGPDGVPKRDTWGWDGEWRTLLSSTGPSPRK